jgi:hypothetical protein
MITLVAILLFAFAVSLLLAKGRRRRTFTRTSATMPVAVAVLLCSSYLMGRTFSGALLAVLGAAVALGLAVGALAAWTLRIHRDAAGVTVESGRGYLAAWASLLVVDGVLIVLSRVPAVHDRLADLLPAHGLGLSAVTTFVVVTLVAGAIAEAGLTALRARPLGTPTGLAA